MQKDNNVLVIMVLRQMDNALVHVMIQVVTIAMLIQLYAKFAFLRSHFQVRDVFVGLVCIINQYLQHALTVTILVIIVSALMKISVLHAIEKLIEDTFIKILVLVCLIMNK